MTAKRTGRKLWSILMFAVLSIILLTACGKSDKYEEAAKYMFEGKYPAAIEIYTELGDYENSQELLFECRYQIADRMLISGEYPEAIRAFEVLGDYADSKQKILECYYGLGQEAFRQEDYEEAVSCFLQAGNRPDVQTELDRAYYEFGHALFLEGRYIAAQNQFDKIKIMPDYAQPHFQYLEDAREYLNRQADMLNDDFSCLISQRPLLPPGDTLCEAVSNYVSFQCGSAYYDMAEKTLEITAQYYPGHRILQAWKSGDISGLSEDEKQALQVAEDLVAKAKENNNDPLDIERYLYDWLCDHIVYESPNMDVDTETYLQLRQLNCLGALLDGKANCQGYSDAFYLLSNMAGFDVCWINGTGEWEPHSWNGIMLDGKCYFVDVTFGDVDELGSSGKTYAWFNCAYDPEVYTVDGGTEVFPDLVTEDDLSQSYYVHNDSVFSELSEATCYLLQQYKDHGRGYTFAMVQDMEVTNEELESSVWNNSEILGVDSYQITYMTEYYNGNTYIVIQWH